MHRLNLRQRLAFDKACAGKSVVITGIAGTGKSFVIDQIMIALRAKFKRVQSLACSNVAADNIKGLTFHKAMGICVLAEESTGAFLHQLAKQMQKKGKPAKFKQNLKDLDVIFIDEFGIVGRFMFTCLDAACRIARSEPTKPFGGIQVIAAGDPMQLSTVKGFPCYLCNNWSETFGDEYVHLTDVVRQSQAEFVSLLMQIRLSDVQKSGMDILLARQAAYSRAEMEGTLPQDMYYLFPRSVGKGSATEFNEKKLASLAGESAVFEPRVEYWNGGWLTKKLVRPDPKTVLSKEARRVAIRKGAVVSVTDTVNSKLRGKRGVVTEIHPDGVRVEFFERSLGAVLIPRKKQTWDGRGIYQTVVATWMPLELDWARSVHRSQCLSLDNVAFRIDDSAFLYGQVYTAASRPRTLEGLWIMGSTINRAAMKTKQIVGFPGD